MHFFLIRREPELLLTLANKPWVTVLFGKSNHFIFRCK